MADKKEYRWFLLPEYEEEEQYLSDMAKKGYLFERVTIFGAYHFKKSEPTNMIYRLDFNPQKKENRDSYLQMYRDYGWTYLQDLNDYSYFCKEEDGTDDEIFNDNESRMEMMERIYKRKMLPILVIFLCCLIPQGMRMIMTGNFTDTISIMFYILWIALMVIYIIMLTRCAAGFDRLRKKYDVK
ncbi:MAG: DUF2812 domain-containing protein [Firmicutes bacterium]|nr:DUF2812 domain-containing protein [Bacillota bacterium]